MECLWRIAFENSKNGAELFFPIKFSIFSRIKFCRPNFHTHISHTILPLQHRTPHNFPSSLPSHPSFPPCAIKWGIYSTLKEVQISLYPATSSRDKIPYVTPIMHASSCGKYRCRTPASQVSHPVSSSHDLINILSFGRVRIAGAHDPAEREDVKRDDIVEIHWPYYLLDCVLHKESFCLIAESCWDGWT
jgi:hypothetical protein